MFALVCFLGSGLGGFLVYAGVWLILVIVVCFYLGVGVIDGWLYCVWWCTWLMLFWCNCGCYAFGFVLVCLIY